MPFSRYQQFRLLLVHHTYHRNFHQTSTWHNLRTIPLIKIRCEKQSVESNLLAMAKIRNVSNKYKHSTFYIIIHYTISIYAKLPNCTIYTIVCVYARAHGEIEVAWKYKHDKKQSVHIYHNMRSERPSVTYADISILLHMWVDIPEANDVPISVKDTRVSITLHHESHDFTIQIFLTELGSIWN